MSETSKRKPPSDPTSDEPLVPFPIPALVVLLANLKRQKGSPLTESEVNEARDKCVCIMLPVSAAQKMIESRGYADIDPERAWEHWQRARQELDGDPAGT